MRLISYVKNPIEYIDSNDSERVGVEGIDRLKILSKGRGVLYSWIPNIKGGRWSCQFDLMESTAVEYSLDEFHRISLALEPGFKFPCSGVISWTAEGYIIAPAIKLVKGDGSELILMFVTPPTTAYKVDVEKTSLSISGYDATVILSSENGELRCQGTISGKFKAARIILDRNPRLSFYREGFKQTIAEIMAPGEIRGVWKPVARDFEGRVLAFDPFNIRSNMMDDLRESFGDPDEDTEFMTDYVVGDGTEVNYSLRLSIDRGLGRHDFDETRLTVT